MFGARRRTLAWAVAFLASLCPGSAGAGGPLVSLEHSLDARGRFMRALPSLRLDRTLTPLREVPAARLPALQPLTMVGMGADSSVVTSHRYEVPLLGLEVLMAVGPSSRGLAAVDGSVVGVKPWTAKAATVLLPGFGLRAVERRWQFSGRMRPVVSVFWADADVASGGGWTATDGSAVSVAAGLRVELEACRRLDVHQRACLLASPSLYEFQPLGAFTVALRWESNAL